MPGRDPSVPNTPRTTAVEQNKFEVEREQIAGRVAALVPEIKRLEVIDEESDPLVTHWTEEDEEYRESVQAQRDNVYHELQKCIYDAMNLVRRDPAVQWKDETLQEEAEIADAVGHAEEEEGQSLVYTTPITTRYQLEIQKIFLPPVKSPARSGSDEEIRVSIVSTRPLTREEQMKMTHAGLVEGPQAEKLMRLLSPVRSEVPGYLSLWIQRKKGGEYTLVPGSLSFAKRDGKDARTLVKDILTLAEEVEKKAIPATA